MSEGDDSSSPSLLNSVGDQFNKLPASQDASVPPGPIHGLFSGERSVQELLGSSEFADIVLWRKKHVSAAILVGATAIWIIFEWLDYHVLSLAVMGLLIAMGVLFLWSNVAPFINRPFPPVTNMQLSEETAIRAAAALRQEVNRFIIMLHEIALGKDIKLFIMIEFCLWLLSVVGGWCDFLTLIYAGIVLVLAVPLFYEKYEDKINNFMQRALNEFHKLYEKISEKVKSKMNQASSKEKKAQ